MHLPHTPTRVHTHTHTQSHTHPRTRTLTHTHQGVFRDLLQFEVYLLSEGEQNWLYHACSPQRYLLDPLLADVKVELGKHLPRHTEGEGACGLFRVVFVCLEWEIHGLEWDTTCGYGPTHLVAISVLNTG